MTDNWGGFWTEAKLLVLERYLRAFNLASKRWNGTVYLDLFAGKLTHGSPDPGTLRSGSTKIALETIPPFERVVFWEKEPSTAAQLRSELHRTRPTDDRWHLIVGDSNKTIDSGLAKVSDLRKKPTFAFIDPKGLNVSWTTLEKLSRWRIDSNKVELWILLIEPAIQRVLGLRDNRGRNTAQQLSSLYGCDDWLAIHERRRDAELSADEARAEYVNLLRWRLQHKLGYKITHPLSLTNVTGSPVYTMVFATDHQVGDKIMRDIYSMAQVREIPRLQSLARDRRQKAKHETMGVMSLFDTPSEEAEGSKYIHSEPWEPPERRQDDSILEELDQTEEVDDFGGVNPSDF